MSKISFDYSEIPLQSEKPQQWHFHLEEKSLKLSSEILLCGYYLQL